jgi:hypothetical protein
MVEYILAIIIGGVITLLISRWYYIKASEDLRLESAALRSKVDIVLRALEEYGIVKLVRDKSGEITGITIHGVVSMTGTGSIIAKATVIPRQEG